MDTISITCHLLFHTWQGRRLLTPAIRREFSALWRNVVKRHNITLRACSGDESVMYIIAELHFREGEDTGVIDRCVALLKSVSSAHVRRLFPELRTCPGFWSRGYHISFIQDVETGEGLSLLTEDAFLYVGRREQNPNRQMLGIPRPHPPPCW